MKRTLLSAFFILFFLNSNAQQLDVSIGTSYGRYAAMNSFSLGYFGKANPGFYGELSYSQTYLKRFGFSLGIGIANYGGYVHSSNGAIMGPYTRSTNSRVSVFTFNITPIIVSFWNRLQFGVGYSYGIQVDNTFEGSDYGTTLNEYQGNYYPTFTEYPIEADYILSHYYNYLNTFMRYSFDLGKIKLTPFYQFSVGLTSEINVISPYQVTSYRHILGLQMNLPFKSTSPPSQ